MAFVHYKCTTVYRPYNFHCLKQYLTIQKMGGLKVIQDNETITKNSGRKKSGYQWRLEKYKDHYSTLLNL